MARPSQFQATLFTQGAAPLRWWGRLLVVGIVVGLFFFGGAVLVRSAFLHRRMTDAHVFFHAAWAVRAGEDLYTTTSDGLHYVYPPLFAIAMAPFADAPVGAERHWMLPYPVSVVIWYMLNVLCGMLAIHWLAACSEKTDAGISEPPPWSHDWCRHRIVPFLMCLAPFGNTLSYGQVNLLVLLLIAGAIRASARGRNFQAGLWLGGAICIKVMPAFLLLYPIWRRDWRWLAGTAVGCVVGLVLVPAAVLGPARFWHYAVEYSQMVLIPGVGVKVDSPVRGELVGANAITNQSIQGVLYAWKFLGVPIAARPAQLPPAIGMSHWIVGTLVTLITVFAGAPWRWTVAGRLSRAGVERPAEPAMVGLLSLGVLTTAMLMVSPVCHEVYFVFCLTLVVPLVYRASGWKWPRARFAQWTLAGIYTLVNCFVLLPGPFEITKHLRLAAVMNLGLWAYGLCELWREARRAGAG